ncbi:MAG: bifunctional 4-hydroxy-2-oxoglutarate aldolase/2-dehydro-3-deoxy-phosphogluconate aldolase [Pedosphaera sp.]|nr:bifunctional 4-hydroxy-2-oxoglutarate aldolase/2-dehydro-3-deoxy-phosphogluconate aldolase [Pedosphaera sp.]
MLTKSDIIEHLLDPGVIAVVRALRREQVLPLSEALVAGGITAIEITLTTPDAIGAIREAREKIAHRALIGVGTILKPFDCQQALDAGAQFVVTPICRPEFVALAHRAGKPVMLGAYTPTEAQLAHEAGADFVKFFPADGLGPSYIKGIRAPLPHLRIVPTGGVDLKTIGDFFKAGCVAVGAGSALLGKEILETDDWPALTKRAAEFVAAARAGRRG